MTVSLNTVETDEVFFTLMHFTRTGVPENVGRCILIRRRALNATPSERI